MREDHQVKGWFSISSLAVYYLSWNDKCIIKVLSDHFFLPVDCSSRPILKNTKGNHWQTPWSDLHLCVYALNEGLINTRHVVSSWTAPGQKLRLTRGMFGVIFSAAGEPDIRFSSELRSDVVWLKLDWSTPGSSLTSNNLWLLLNGNKLARRHRVKSCDCQTCPRETRGQQTSPHWQLASGTCSWL